MATTQTSETVVIQQLPQHDILVNIREVLDTERRRLFNTYTIKTSASLTTLTITGFCDHQCVIQIFQNGHDKNCFSQRLVKNNRCSDCTQYDCTYFRKISPSASRCITDSLHNLKQLIGILSLLFAIYDVSQVNFRSYTPACRCDL